MAALDTSFVTADTAELRHDDTVTAIDALQTVSTALMDLRAFDRLSQVRELIDDLRIAQKRIVEKFGGED
jgi:hypothetical protein